MFAVTVVVFLVALGVANVAMYSRWHEVEDGVLWSARAEGVTATEVAAGTAAAAAGIERGDVLLAVNGSPVQTPSDVVEYQHRGHAGTRLVYTLLRSGARQPLELALAPAPRGNSMYFVLAAVGLFTLLVGASVRLRRPRDQATLHFFWLCVAFFGVFTFSFNGPFDRLDWAFYWGDAIAFALLPPLLLHFTMVFPERPTDERRTSNRERLKALFVPLMYLPALALGAARVIAVTRGIAGHAVGPALLARARSARSLRADLPVRLCGGGARRAGPRVPRDHVGHRPPPAALDRVGHGARRRVRSGSATRCRGSFGVNPPIELQLTAVLLAVVPLTFACAIVRYRLRDVEVIVKRGFAYTAFLAASVALYAALRKLTGFVFVSDADDHNWIIAALATLVIVLLARPVKDAVQNALDRAFYRDRYDYRRALVAFARDLNSDLDIVRLSQRLVARIVETLVVDRMALMLAAGDPSDADDDQPGDFTSIGDYGFAQPVPPLSRRSSMMSRLDGGHTVALDDPIVAARFLAEEVEAWRDAGIYYFVPCVFEGRTIAVLALSRKETDEPFNSEDLGLLTAVAGQVATAIENGRLYRQLHLKAEELGRMREFNENILESLDNGLVVFDADEKIVRWNRALEEFYGVAREAAIGCRLGDLFDAPFVEALRAARQDHPYGATLYRVPLSSRDSSMPRLLVNATEVPLQNASGDDAVVGMLMIIEDITDRVQLEEQLQISEKMASIGLLAAGVAHEVNTPLTGISSFTQMLLEGADPGRSQNGPAREDRTADLPRRQDRQRPVEPVPSRYGV